MLRSLVNMASTSAMGVSVPISIPTSVIPSIANLFRRSEDKKKEPIDNTNQLSEQITSVLDDIKDELDKVAKHLTKFGDNETLREYKEVIEKLLSYSSQSTQFDKQQLREIVSLFRTVEKIQDDLSEVSDKHLKDQLFILESKVGRNIEKLVPIEESISNKLDVQDPRKWMNSVFEFLEKSPIVEEVSTAVLAGMPFGQILLGIQSLLGLQSPIELIAKTITELPTLFSKGFSKLYSGIMDIGRFIISKSKDLFDSISSIFFPISSLLKGILKYVKLSYLKEAGSKIWNLLTGITGKLLGGISLGGIVSKILPRSSGVIPKALSKSGSIVSRVLSKSSDVFSKIVDKSFTSGKSLISKVLSRPGDISSKVVDKSSISKTLFEKGISSKSISLPGRGIISNIISKVAKPSIVSKFSGVASKALPFLGSILELGGLAKNISKEGAGEAVKDFIFGSDKKSAVSRVTSTALRGATIGSAIGSIVPGAGTLIGGLVGGGLGTITSLIGRDKFSSFVSNIKNLFARDKIIQQSRSKVDTLVKSSKSSESNMIDKLKEVISSTTKGTSNLVPSLTAEGTGIDASKIPVIVDDVGIVLLGSGLL